MLSSEYDLHLLSVNSDHRRLVDDYSFMLLGKEAPKYFRVERSESQMKDFYSLMRAAMEGYDVNND